MSPGDDLPPAKTFVRKHRAAIGARLLHGRDLLPGDTAQAQPVVVVTADFVKRYVRSADPIGARLKMGGPDSPDPWRTIVGVFADIRNAALDEAPRPEVWFPYAQIEDGLLTRLAARRLRSRAHVD